MLCAEPGHYFDEGEEECHSCTDESARVLLFVGGILLLMTTLGLIAHYHVLARAGLSVVWHTVVVAADRVSLATKLKISISFYQARRRVNTLCSISAIAIQRSLRFTRADYHATRPRLCHRLSTRVC